jgi:ankyrin repeat protein
VTDTAYAHTWSTVRMARSLVRAGAFVELEAGPESLAPLMLAATGRSPYLIDVLHQGGARLEQAHSKTGMKPLHFSIKENKHALSDHLLDIGADAGSVTADGTSALMMAADNGDTDLEGKLIAKKAPVNYQQPGGKRETALMRAGRRGNMKGIGILLDADADPLLTDAFNFRASHHARQNYNRMAAEALEEAETKALARHMDKALDQETRPPRP